MIDGTHFCAFSPRPSSFAVVKSCNLWILAIFDAVNADFATVGFRLAVQCSGVAACHPTWTAYFGQTRLVPRHPAPLGVHSKATGLGQILFITSVKH